jgi:hypothetical protein
LKTEDGNALDEFVNPGFTEKMTHIEALELRETVVEGKKVKTTKLLVYIIFKPVYLPMKLLTCIFISIESNLVYLNG